MKSEQFEKSFLMFCWLSICLYFVLFSRVSAYVALGLSFASFVYHSEDRFSFLTQDKMVSLLFEE